MKKCILILASTFFVNCLVVEERKVALNVDQNKKFYRQSASFLTSEYLRNPSSSEEWVCDNEVKRELNYNNIFSKSGDYTIHVRCDESSNRNPNLTDILLGLGGIVTLGIIPIRLHGSKAINIHVMQATDKIANYDYNNTTYVYWSWLLIPFSIYQKITDPTVGQSDLNFIKNTNSEMHDKMVSYNSVIKEREDIVKQEKELKLQKDSEANEKEMKEREEKLKSIKFSSLPIGAIYCNEESFIIALTFNPSQQNLTSLLYIKECFQVEDAPIKAKLMPYDNGLFVYVDNRKYFSTKKLLQAR